MYGILGRLAWLDRFSVESCFKHPQFRQYIVPAISTTNVSPRASLQSFPLCVRLQAITYKMFPMSQIFDLSRSSLTYHFELFRVWALYSFHVSRVARKSDFFSSSSFLTSRAPNVAACFTDTAHDMYLIELENKAKHNQLARNVSERAVVSRTAQTFFATHSSNSRLFIAKNNSCPWFTCDRKQS
jgi:hypothetical protein